MCKGREVEAASSRLFAELSSQSIEGSHHFTIPPISYQCNTIASSFFAAPQMIFPCWEKNILSNSFLNHAQSLSQMNFAHIGICNRHITFEYIQNMRLEEKVLFRPSIPLSWLDCWLNVVGGYLARKLCRPLLNWELTIPTRSKNLHFLKPRISIEAKHAKLVV